MVPVGNLARRELCNGGGSQQRKDVRLGSPLGVINRFPAPAFVCLEVILNRAFDGERALAGIVPFVPPRLRSPPRTRGCLGLPVVEDGNPVSVLQIVRGA